jgi:putative transposase
VQTTPAEAAKGRADLGATIMSQSLSNVLVHLIFSTKNRAMFLEPSMDCELHPYLATACRTCGCPAHAVGGAEDHVHIVCSLGRTISVSELLEEIKKASSKWIKTKGPRYRGFAWQSGYGAFSIGQSQLAATRRYVAGQREHHRHRTFQEEFLEFLTKYQVAYDERFVWD